MDEGGGLARRKMVSEDSFPVKRHGLCQDHEQRWLIIFWQEAPACYSSVQEKATKIEGTKKWLRVLEEISTLLRESEGRTSLSLKDPVSSSASTQAQLSELEMKENIWQCWNFTEIGNQADFQSQLESMANLSVNRIVLRKSYRWKRGEGGERE